MTEKDQVEPVATLLIDTILPAFSSGRFSVTANGFPALSLDCGSRSLDLEARGVEESGFKLSQVVGHRGGLARLLKDSETVARKLAREGWTLTLYDRGSESSLR